MNRLLLPVIVLALALNCVGCAKTETKPAAPAKVEAKVKAGDLIDAFTKNSVAAEGKYKGKVIQVSGKVASIQKAVLLGHDVQVVAEDAPEPVEIGSGVHCFISEAAKRDVETLKPGDKVTMQGTCDGSVLGGQIKVSKCTVVK